MGIPILLRAFSTTIAALTFATIILCIQEKFALYPGSHSIPSTSFASRYTPPSWDASQFAFQSPHSNEQPTLLQDKYYITAWAEPSWTKTFVSHLNVIYLGILTNRIPILASFTPSDSDVSVPFSRVFDVERFWKERGIPLIDWTDVRSGVRPGTELGCWSVSQAIGSQANRSSNVSSAEQPASGAHPNVTYTTIPDWTVFNNAPDFCKFSSLSRLSFPEGRRRAIGDTQPGPDQQLMCFDSLLQVGEDDLWEWENDYSPVWNLIGKHLHFHPNLIKIARAYLSKAFGVAGDGDIPSFISVQVDTTGTLTLTPSISSVAKLVNEIAVDLAGTTGVTVIRVLVFSDVQDQMWWREVVGQGWISIDHLAERTTNRYGASFEPIIDTVMQSMSAGIVRTHGSTAGLITQRRVQDWSGGPTRMMMGRSTVRNRHRGHDSYHAS